MKNKGLLVLFLVFLLVSLSACGKKVTPKELKMETKVIIDSSLTLDQIGTAYDGTDDSAWLQSLKAVAEDMVDSGFTYNLSGIKKTLSKAKDGNRHGDCAHLISWALQNYGVLEEGQNFYSKKKGVLSCKKDGKTYKNLTEHAEIISVDGIDCKDQEALKKVLKVGDICCYSKHMNVVAGLNKKGNVIYYDAGLTPVDTHKQKGQYTDKLKKPYSRPNMNNRLYTIIRLKDQGREEK